MVAKSHTVQRVFRLRVTTRRRLTAWVVAILVCWVAGCSNGTAVDTSNASNEISISQRSLTAPDTTIDRPNTQLPTPTGRPVVIDTDMSAEGVMSIFYLLDQEGLDVRAITVSGAGLVHCESGVDQVLTILRMVQQESIPVACGPETPISGFNAFPGAYRASADEIPGLHAPHNGEASDLEAPKLIVSAINSSPQPVLVYADGPQTNLAHALNLDPTIASNVEMAFLMGGAFAVPGNAIKNPDAEWNIWVDPAAADRVFRSGIPITLVPLDATNQVPIHIFHLAALEQHSDSVMAEAVVTILRGSEQLSTGNLYFWDQLTAGLMVDETYATLEYVSVEVVIDEDRSVAGRTVVAGNGTRMRIAQSIERSRFETDFLSTIAETNVGPIAISADITGTYDGTEWTLDPVEPVSRGTYTIHLTNSSNRDIGLAFGWLEGDATPQDLDEWDGVAQPPFYTLESFRFGVAHSEIVAVIDLDSEEMYTVVGLDPAANSSTAIGHIEVVDI